MTQQHSQFTRWTSRLVMMCMLVLGMPLQPAFAGIVDTDRAVSHQLAGQERARISAFMDRQDVLAQLQTHGVTKKEAQARVLALTDQEVHNIAGQLDQLPAGGDSILGVLLTIFIVLLVTDILGFTKVFPFTRAIQ